MRADEENKGRPDAAAELSGLAYHRSSDLVERVLATAREQLGMEVAFVSEFAEGRTVFRSLEGDTGSFGFSEGVGTPLEDSFCRRVIEGRIPSVVPDAGRDPAIRDLGVTREAGIGSYVGVPLQFSDTSGGGYGWSRRAPARGPTWWTSARRSVAEGRLASELLFEVSPGEEPVRRLLEDLACRSEDLQKGLVGEVALLLPNGPGRAARGSRWRSRSQA